MAAVTEYVRVCPVCDTENPPSAARCKCGTSLAAIDFSIRRAAVEEAVPPPVETPVAVPAIEEPVAPPEPAIVCPHADCAQPNPPGQTRCVYCNRPLSIAAAPPPAAVAGARPLPAALRERYRVVDLFPVSGSEADLMLVADAASFDRSVVKLYRHGLEPDFRLLDILSRTVGDSVVRVLEHGVSDGVAYERLEYVPHGTLADLLENGALPPEDVRRIVAEIAEALNGIHAHRILHRDLKPDNVLLRSKSPLELALTDFGIASLSEATQRFTSAARTTRYAAPEALTGVIDEKSDWWSLGMIALEAATGRHPFDGLTEHIMNHHLATRPIDVRGVYDDRLRLLCRGLLLRDPRRRWGAEEVARWLADDPTLEVPDDAGASAVRPYRMGATECTTAAELALAAVKNWEAARKDLARGQFTNWIEHDLHDHNLARRLHDIREHREMSDDMRLLRFAREAAPDLPPVWRGVPLGEREIVDAARRAESGDRQAEAWLSSIALEDVLNEFGPVQELARLHERWNASWSRFETLWERARAHELAWRKQPRAVAGAARAEVVSYDDVMYGAAQRLSPPARRDVNAALILAETDAAFADAARTEAAAGLADVTGYCSWYEALYRDAADDPAGLVVLQRLLRHARDDANKEKDRLGASESARARIIAEARQDICDALRALPAMTADDDEDDLDRRTRTELYDAMEPLLRACGRAAALGLPHADADELGASADRIASAADAVREALAGLEHAENVNAIFLKPDRLAIPGVFTLILWVRTRLFAALFFVAFLIFAWYRVRRTSRARRKLRSAWRALRSYGNAFLRAAQPSSTGT
ncbi:MAG TPA: protein kinase [Burkholderiales bacterium]|nr:protein kinase [Burkholderiales bacterium]